MAWMTYDRSELVRRLNVASKTDLMTLLRAVDGLLQLDEYPQLPAFVSDTKMRRIAKKVEYVQLFEAMFSLNGFKERLLEYLHQTELSRTLYETLTWRYQQMDTPEAAASDDAFSIDEMTLFGVKKVRPTGPLCLIERRIRYSAGEIMSDLLSIEPGICTLLELVLPLPDDYELLPLNDHPTTAFTYENEAGVLRFIQTIFPMLRDNLIVTTKSTEKPQVKSLKLLKSAVGMPEFFSESRQDALAVEMLTRSFHSAYATTDPFKKHKEPLAILKTFTALQLDDNVHFFISRMFTSHLKKVRFDLYYTSEHELFNILKTIIQAMPKTAWVSMENCFSFCYYRRLYFNLESDWKTGQYWMECEKNGELLTCKADDYYDEICFRPVLKAAFFYLGALGLVELAHDAPGGGEMTALGKPYISVWDGLKYFRLTPLGRYVFGFSRDYTPKFSDVKTVTTRFDTFAPIITVDPQDTVMRARLEPYAVALDDGRYVLDYGVLFKECKNVKELKLKIERFYEQIEPEPPQVFVDFFDQARARAGLLRRKRKLAVLELEPVEGLPELFMQEQKLHPMIIKAEGYRIIVAEEDLPKLSKILKTHGFFINF